MKVTSTETRFARATDGVRMQSWIRDELERYWAVPVAFDEFYVSRVFPGPKDGLTIQYITRVRRGDEEPTRLVLCGHLRGANRSEALSDRAVLHETEIDLFVPVFPHDPALPALPELVESDQQLLAPALGLNGEKPTIECEIMSYRLGKRCVLRYNVSGVPQKKQVVAKVLRPKKLPAAVFRMRALHETGFDVAASDGITLPEIQYVDETKGLLFMEAAPGHSPHDLVGDERFIAGCDAAARVLKKLHAQVVPGLVAYSIGDELQQLQSWRAVVARVVPQLLPNFSRAYEILQSHRDDGEMTGEGVCIHRDFFDKQILFSAERTTLLDCDTLSIGDPAQDCGNFVAHMHLRAEQHPEHRTAILSAVDSFKRVYDDNDASFVRREKLWRAMSLLRLAAIYAMRPRWKHLSSELVKRAVRDASTS